MTGLTYFAALAVLFAAMIFGQSSTSNPSSDPSNSSKSAQTQSSTNTDQSGQNSHTTKGAKTPGQESQSGVPDTTVRDQQRSTTSTTGASGQNNQPPSTSTMGTSSTGSDKMEGTEQEPSTQPQLNTPADQQPNSSTNPSSTPQAYLIQTPAARAVATHTPDPGTCMNPAALQTASDGSQPQLSPNCK